MLAEVSAVRRLTGDCFELRAAVSLTDARPGRFVHIAVPGSLLRRPISLAGAEEGAMRLVFAVKGEGTAWLSRRRPGDTLDVLGALGNGFPEDDGSVLLCGGGVGLPPLLYYASRHPGHCHTLAGFRNADAVMLTNEFSSIELFTDDGSAGTHGVPTDSLPALLASGRYERVLACGPLPLLKATARLCLEARVPCYVSVEERMSCGVGACMVCACSVNGHYRRVCRDGPVFPAGEVDFS